MAKPARVVLSLALGLVLGCAGDAPTAASPVASSVDGPVVAHVDGEAIGLGEVQRLCDETGLTPRLALERLVAERLLVRHAAERGYGDLPAVARAATQARVRVLLAQTIESPGTASGLDAQKAKLTELLATLATRSQVAYDEAAIQHAFAPESR